MKLQKSLERTWGPFSGSSPEPEHASRLRKRSQRGMPACATTLAPSPLPVQHPFPHPTPNSRRRVAESKAPSPTRAFPSLASSSNPHPLAPGTFLLVFSNKLPTGVHAAGERVESVPRVTVRERPGRAREGSTLPGRLERGEGPVGAHYSPGA